MKIGFDSDAYIERDLVAIYVKFGSIEDVDNVLEQIHNRIVGAWTLMVIRYS